jgi:hypothetical protein
MPAYVIGKGIIMHTRIKYALCICLSITFAGSASSTTLDPLLIRDLQNGFQTSCVPNIREQLVMSGYSEAADKAENYCRCLGLWYFNDFTESDYAEMQARGGRLPARIEARQLQIQEHCLWVHF